MHQCFFRFVLALLFVPVIALASPADAAPKSERGDHASVHRAKAKPMAAARKKARARHLRRSTRAHARKSRRTLAAPGYRFGQNRDMDPFTPGHFFDDDRQSASSRGRGRAASHAREQALSSFALGGGSSAVVHEARRHIGTNPTGRRSRWCARFMNFVLERSGFRGTGSDMARSFASYGRRISGPRIGAIAVMSRGRRGGHVGVVSGIDKRGNPIIISGNHGNRVEESVYPRGRIYAYVLPGS
jgi:uncharacterized protein (TIGR02594 family)